MIRMDGAETVAVKGRAAGLDTTGTMKRFRISNVSEKGVTYLTSGASAQVEFVMMSAKVVFTSTILEINQNSVYLVFPKTLVSVERRKNARYACNEKLKAYVKLGVWSAKDDDFTAPPFYSFQDNIANYLSVIDLSLGGICVATRFPAAFLQLKRGIIDERASLLLPMSVPVPIAAEFRWLRKIKENVFLGDDRKESFQLHFKFGLEFVSLSETSEIALKQFMRNLSQSEAV